MVGLAKWLTQRVVAPLLMGSIPIPHPNLKGVKNVCTSQR